MAQSFSSGYKSEYIALLNEIETKIKQVIQESLLRNRGEVDTNILLLKVIKEFDKEMPKDALDRDKMIRAIMYSKDKWLKKYKTQLEIGWNAAKKQLESVLGKRVETKIDFFNMMLSNLNLLNGDEIVDVTKGSTFVFTKGYPYVENYWNNVRKAFDNLVDESIVEPKRGKTGALSLRSMVELTIRHEFHKDQNKQYKQQGINLVRISTHADCSERCEPFQNKIYSLDGTSGVINGEKYEPIEKATDIFVETKNGRLWKNGLFGFNCRHRMIAYDPNMKQGLDYTHEEMVEEREVSSKQRAMEREIFKLRQSAILIKDTNPKLATAMRKLATEKMERYINYSHKHNHAYYPDRCAISRQLRKVVQESVNKQ